MSPMIQSGMLKWVEDQLRRILIREWTDGLCKEIGLIEKWISEIKDDVEERLSREELSSVNYEGGYYDDVHEGSYPMT